MTFTHTHTHTYTHTGIQEVEEEGEEAWASSKLHSSRPTTGGAGWSQAYAAAARRGSY
jgi:hypothetical protein